MITKTFLQVKEEAERQSLQETEIVGQEASWQ